MPSKSFTRAVIRCPTSHASFSYIYNSLKSSARLIHVLIRHSSWNPRQNVWSLCRLPAALSYLLSLPVSMFPTNWRPSCFPNCVGRCWSLHPALQQAWPRLPFTATQTWPVCSSQHRTSPHRQASAPCGHEHNHGSHTGKTLFRFLLPWNYRGLWDKMKSLLTLKSSPRLSN